MRNIGRAKMVQFRKVELNFSYLRLLFFGKAFFGKAFFALAFFTGFPAAGFLAAALAGGGADFGFPPATFCGAFLFSSSEEGAPTPDAVAVDLAVGIGFPAGGTATAPGVATVGAAPGTAAARALFGLRPRFLGPPGKGCPSGPIAAAASFLAARPRRGGGGGGGGSGGE